MRKQFERVLGVRLSDRARKLSRAHMPGATVGFLDDSVTVSRNSCCTTVRKSWDKEEANRQHNFHGELNNTREATDNASAAVPAPATKAGRCKHKQKRPLPERSWVGVMHCDRMTSLRQGELAQRSAAVEKPRIRCAGADKRQ